MTTTPRDERHRAFGPGSLTAGGLLTAPGRDRLIQNFLLPPGVLDAVGDGWLTPDIPVLVRGRVRIIPIAWWGMPDGERNPESAPAEIKDFARYLLETGMHMAGPWRPIDLAGEPTDSIGSYAAALRASGATKAERFVSVQDHLGVVVVWAGAEYAGDRSVAIHVVPEGWVWSRAATHPVDGIDVSWSWADVIALFPSDHPHR